MTTNKINKISDKYLIMLSDLLKKSYDPTLLISTSFSAKNKDLKEEIGKKKYLEAAVLCILLPSKNNFTPKVILTVRSKKLRKHSGQISFPGGKVERTDKNFIECALRETFEEIGIEGKKVQTLGMMNKYATGSGFLVTPVVAIMTSDIKVKINKDEVEEVIYFPLNYLEKKKNIKKSFFFKDNKSKYFYYDINWKNYRIWGTTASILCDMNKLLNNMMKKND